MDRRRFLVSAALALGLSTTFLRAIADTPVAGHRRRVRRRIRRRHRRRVGHRIVVGRPVWIVPSGVAEGWELVHGDRLVVVKEIRVLDPEGAKREVLVVAGADGKTEEVGFVREDTDGNRIELEGSALPEEDLVTPGVVGELRRREVD